MTEREETAKDPGGIRRRGGPGHARVVAVGPTRAVSAVTRPVRPQYGDPVGIAVVPDRCSDYDAEV